jgi:hypothetical protein
VREKVTISHRGARYEIGRAQHFYGIWAAGTSQSQPRPLEWWPDTHEGWTGAWRRFVALEVPGTIVPVSQRGALFAGASGNPSLPVAAAAVLIVGVVCGLIGLFPGYVGGPSLVQQGDQVVPHAIYLAAWTASAALILLGGTRVRAGALLALGTSIVTFGMFFSDLGEVIAGGSHLLGAGLVLGLIGWLVCGVGSVMAFLVRSPGAPGRPAGNQIGLVAVLSLAALGAAIAFAPSWDSFILRTASGATQTETAGNAFANPGAVIVGDVAVMVALVAVVVVAALWRPVRQGAALLAGAIVPMAAQAISAVIQVGEGASPAQFGFSPAQAAQAGLTIDSGVTPVFWIYCAFVVALIAACGWMFLASGPGARVPSTPAPGGPGAPAPGEPITGSVVTPATQVSDAPGATSA